MKKSTIGIWANVLAVSVVGCARLPSWPSRSSSSIACSLSHPARHPSQMVTGGRILRRRMRGRGRTWAASSGRAEPTLPPHALITRAATQVVPLVFSSTRAAPSPWPPITRARHRPEIARRVSLCNASLGGGFSMSPCRRWRGIRRRTVPSTEAASTKDSSRRKSHSEARAASGRISRGRQSRSRRPSSPWRQTKPAAPASPAARCRGAVRSPAVDGAHSCTASRPSPNQGPRGRSADLAARAPNPRPASSRITDDEGPFRAKQLAVECVGDGS